MKRWQTVQIPLAAGVDTGRDLRAASPPGFEMLVDAQFDEVGGLQTRLPFSTTGITKDIVGGGILTNIRRIEPYGSELLCFTQDTLYSWSEQRQGWISKGEHLAVKTDERTVFATTGDQFECDRAELDGTVVYSWSDSALGTVYTAAIDKVTGAVLMAPTRIGLASRPRLVALDTRILLFVVRDDPDLVVYAIDPAAPELSGSVDIVGDPNFQGTYDVCRVVGQDAAAFVAARVVATSYTVGTVSADLAVTTSTKSDPADDCAAIACSPDGANIVVVRMFTVGLAAIYADVLDASTLMTIAGDVSLASAELTPTHITAAFRNNQDSGQYRCYAFWSGSAAGNSFTTRANWVTPSATTGTAFEVNALGSLASSAFTYNGRVFTWLVYSATVTFDAGDEEFAFAPQNTYFLVRDDGTIWAKAAAGRANETPTDGWLPSVQTLDGSSFTWCGIERRLIRIGGKRRTNYAARSPREITFSFDSDEARRCARIGETLYISGGQILQYDGSQLTEVGFPILPTIYEVTQATTTDGLADGTYAYKMSWRWQNARGETDRSSAANTRTITITSGPDASDTDFYFTSFTRKRSPAIAAEIWRTVVNPTADTPFYLVTDRDPAVTSNPNRYIENDPDDVLFLHFEDELVDADLAANEQHPENGAVLEYLAPPPATIITASADRLFLAGVAGDPDRVWYSRLRNDGEVASFHDSLAVAVPREGGAITGLAFLNETLIVFRETAIYALPGDGYDNTGGGMNYGPARSISTEVGAQNHESIALEPSGLVFQSNKGKYRLNRSWALEYIGGPVDEWDDERIAAVHVVESQHQIRWLTYFGRMLMFDYLIGQWAEWSVPGGVHACIWNGTHFVVTNVDVKKQQTTYDDIDYGLDAKLAPIKLNDLQGAGSVRWLGILGEYRGACRVQVELYRDYQTEPYQTEVWTPTPTHIGEPMQVDVGPSIPKCMAIGVRITAIAAEEDGIPSSEAFKLTGLALDVGIDQGMNRRLPAAQKV